MYGRRGISARALAQRSAPVPLGEQYFRHFRAFCTATPARDNWFLALTLRGALLDAGQAPDFLRGPGLLHLRDDPGRLRLHHGDLGRWLHTTDQRYDGVHLSNLGDWLDEAAFGALLGDVVDRAAPGAAVLWRELQVERGVPDALSSRLRVARLRIDRPHGEQLRAADRFPFYRIVPGEASGA